MPSGHLLGSIPRIEGATSPTDPPGSARGDVPVSATMANLLPSASPALARPSGGVYMGEGISPVPARLAERICRGVCGHGRAIARILVGAEGRDNEGGQVT